MKINRTFLLIPMFLILCTSASAKELPEWAKRYMEKNYSGNATVAWIPGLKLTYPQVASVSAAVFVNVMSLIHENRYKKPEGFTGLLLQAEPGCGGIKSGLGLGSIDSIGYASGLKLSHYRTWKDFGSFEPGEDYIGFEATLSGFFASYSLGVYTGIDSEASNVLFSASFGIGF